MHGVDTVDWKLIGTCNLRCPHCYGPPKTERALPLEELFAIIAKFKALSVRRVVLTGGEPLLVPGIGEVMCRLRTEGMEVALSTNTSFFSKFQSEIERHVSSLNIPLDGSTSAIHQRSRADERTFFSCLEVLRYYRENPGRRPPLLRVGTVYSRATAGDFLAIANLLEPFASAITTWKIYELIDYEYQQDLRRPLLHARGDFESEMIALMQHSRFSGKIVVARASERDRAYFMVNPRGQLVLPTDVGGVTHEVVLGDTLTDSPQELLQRWGESVDSRNYSENHQRHYGS